MERRSGQKSSSTIDERSLASISGAPEADKRSLASMSDERCVVDRSAVIDACRRSIVGHRCPPEADQRSLASMNGPAVIGIGQWCARGRSDQPHAVIYIYRRWPTASSRSVSGLD